MSTSYMLLLMQPRPNKLLDQVRDAIRRKHYAYPTDALLVLDRQVLNLDRAGMDAIQAKQPQ